MCDRLLSGDYEGDVENLDEYDDSQSINFGLFEHQNAAPIQEQGALKTSEVIEDEDALYSDRKSDYSVTMQRLLWVDGYEMSTQEESDRQEMTLVVLKMVFTSLDPETRFQHITATLKLGSWDNGQEPPQIEAWAPFRQMQRSNMTTSQREVIRNNELGGKIGYSGSEISILKGYEKKISWEQTDFDECWSTMEVDDNTKKVNGVTWFMKQNQLHNKGINQELWASILFSRSSQASYKAVFSIEACTGSFRNATNKARSFFGIPPRRLNVYSITPWKKQVCNHEGKDIKNSIDTLNLGKLREPTLRTSLNVAWGPSYLASTELASSKPLGIATPRFIGADDLPEKNGDVDKDERLGGLPAPTTQPKAAPLSVTQPDTHAEGAPVLPQQTRFYHQKTLSDTTRLTGVEGRMAQMEARIATQDTTIMQLRQALLESEIRMWKLEQAVLSLTNLQPRAS